MPPIRPPRSEWDLLSNTKKAAPVPAKFFVPVQEENTIGVAQTGLKQLGGVVNLNLPTAKTTESCAELRTMKQLNVRPKLEPCEKYRRPMTSSQEIGWGMTIPK